MPRPSLSLHPSQRVSLGDTVTLRCHLPQTTAWVRLYRYENPTYIEQKDKVQHMAEFSLAGIKQFDAVRYRCQYQGLEPSGTSQKSDPVKLVVTGEGTEESRWPWAVPSVTSLCSDYRYPPPGISLSPKEHVKMGTNISIQCWNKKHGASFLLHKGGHSAPVCLAPIYRRERRFFEICMPGVRLRNNGSNGWSDQFITNVNKGDEERGGRTLLRIGVMGKGRRAIDRKSVV